MNTTEISFYTSKSETYSNQLKLVSKKLKRFAWYRFFSFLFIFLPFFIFESISWQAVVLCVASVIVFLFLVKKNIQIEKQKKELLVSKKICEDEVLALNHSYAHFKSGKEFQDTNHVYSYDLDLFGEGSVYQFLNRTTTLAGEKKLARWLANPLQNKVEIEKRQQALKELSQKTGWRFQFRVKGSLFEETKNMNRGMRSWSNLELPLKNPKQLIWVIRILPAVTVLSALLWAFGQGSFYLAAMVFFQLILVFSYWKTTGQYVDFFGRKSELLGKYMELLRFIEESEFHSEYLLQLKNKVIQPVSASLVFKDLKSRVKELEYRQNLLVGFFLNSFFLWDIRCVFALWNWHNKYHNLLADWLEIISETDALVSIANFSDNNPEFVFPEIAGGDFLFSAKEIGHPLLKSEKRICNNFEISGWNKAVIVTGANMAGKSTFLRTLGVNLVLAGVGAPVCATKLKFTPVSVFTNMRTTDSLVNDESYFFAELKRIKTVLDKLQEGEKIFVILDEMLKGTNSVDKLNGSKMLVKKLLQYNAVSVIATHDLKLSEMENEFPEQIFNKCFEIRIENNELIFDYLLTDGITQTMNATFLMKKMGII